MIMNNKLTKTNNYPLIFGILISLIIGLIWITFTDSFIKNKETLSNAIIIDFLITIPIIYFFLIRKKNIPKLTTISIFVIGIIISSFVIPKENQQLLNFITTWFVPILEIAIAILVISKIRYALKRIRQEKHTQPDFFTLLKQTCTEILPKSIAILLAMEIAVFYFGFISWKKQIPKTNEYSYHKSSGTIALLASLIFIIGIETFSLHTLIAKWNLTAAWIATGISIYSGIQIFGFLKSMLVRPILIDNGTLFLRYGIMSETSIDIDSIDSITISSSDIALDKTTIKLSPFGELESHNVILNLKKEHLLTGLYGIKKSYQNIAFFVDQKEEFSSHLNQIKKNSLQ